MDAEPEAGPMSHEKAEIADQLRRSEPSAMDFIAMTFHGPLYRFFLCQDISEQAAEELVAETFVQLIESFRRFHGDDSQVRAFVYATARHIRSRYRARKSRGDVSLDSARPILDPGLTPIDNLVDRERSDALIWAIKQLSETVREIVLLRYVEELSMQEIAATVDMPEGTVKSHLRRGKIQLKTLLLQAQAES